MNLPNKITISRICLIPVFAALFYIKQIPANYLLAAAVFIIAAATDALDGYIARKNNIVTNMGKFLDPIADKVLVATAYIIMLTNPQILSPLAGGICVSLIMARELIVSGFRMLAAGTGLVLAADKLGKLKTVFQDLSVLVLIVSAGIAGAAGGTIHTAGMICLYIATVLTLWSGTSYIVKNRQVLKNGD